MRSVNIPDTERDSGSSTAALSCEEVTFGYEPDRPVITGLSVQMQPGRLCAMIGPNAAGKSTLLRLMLGQLRPWSGRVRLDGTDVGAMDARKRAALLSYVPQHGSVAFAFTTRQVVDMGRYTLRRDRGAIDKAISGCDLTDLEDRPFIELSAGQQQRVLLARALGQSSGEGRAMLLDEPASAMDLWHVHRTMRLLAEHARHGLAVLVVLHDVNLAARYADDVWLIDNGALVEAGTWQQVLQPRVLEPIYRVGLRVAEQQCDDRPLFIVEPDNTL